MKTSIFTVFFAFFALTATRAQQPDSSHYALAFSIQYISKGTDNSFYYSVLSTSRTLKRETNRYIDRFDDYARPPKVDSIALSDQQWADLLQYSHQHLSQPQYSGICRALSNVYAKITLTQGSTTVEWSYAPCRTTELIEPYFSLQKHLDRLLDEK